MSEWETSKLIRQFCLPNQKKYPMCPCDGTVYFDAKHLEIKEDASQECRHCGLSRFLADGKTPRKILYYNPIEDLLKIVFGDAKSAAEVSLNREGGEEEKDPTMHDIRDSPYWKELILKDAEFWEDMRNIVLKFSTDGFPLDKLMRISAWAGASQILNKSPQTRSKPHNMLLHWMTTGGRSPSNLQPIMAVLVDDLLEGWSNGFPLFDASRQENFTARVKLLLVSADCPGK